MTVRHIRPDGLFNIPVYTHAVTVFDQTLVFISGQVALDADGNVVAGDLQTQGIQVFENLKRVLAAVNADLSQVVKLTIYIANFQFEERDIVAHLLREYIGTDNPPANTLLGVQSLARPGLRIEVEAVAAI